uniref:Uncharacterized protein n=1 Tax=Arundo donax TaxID=35708 RepID=A0A0A9HV71_ARUDO
MYPRIISSQIIWRGRHPIQVNNYLSIGKHQHTGLADIALFCNFDLSGPITLDFRKDLSPPVPVTIQKRIMHGGEVV